MSGYKKGKDRLEENDTTTGTYNLDYNFDTWLLTFTGAVTFTESNLPTSGVNTKVITIHILDMDGFAGTLATGWGDNITGALDNTAGVWNTIVVEYIKSGVYKVDISQPS